MSYKILDAIKEIKELETKQNVLKSKLVGLTNSINIARTQIIAIAQKVGAEKTDPGVE